MPPGAEAGPSRGAPRVRLRDFVVLSEVLRLERLAAELLELERMAAIVGLLASDRAPVYERPDEPRAGLLALLRARVAQELDARAEPGTLWRERYERALEVGTGRQPAAPKSAKGAPRTKKLGRAARRRAEGERRVGAGVELVPWGS